MQVVEKVKKEWYETYNKTQEVVKAIGEYGQSERSEERCSLPRLNGIAPDGLALLSSLQFRLDLLAPQLLTDEEVESASTVLESWKTQSQSLRFSLRDANLQAKENVKKAVQEKRELLQGGGGESTVRRRNLQTKAGMTSAAESITESLHQTRQLRVQRELLLGGGGESTVRRRNLEIKAGVTSAAESVTESLCRTRQLMVQEVERSTSTFMTGGHRTREYCQTSGMHLESRINSILHRQDVKDRIMLAVGFFLFTLAVLYVVSKRIALLPEKGS